MEGEEEEGGRAHFSLDSILQQERQAGKKTRRKKRKESQVLTDISHMTSHEWSHDPLLSGVSEGGLV